MLLTQDDACWCSARVYYCNRYLIVVQLVNCCSAGIFNRKTSKKWKKLDGNVKKHKKTVHKKRFLFVHWNIRFSVVFFNLRWVPSHTIMHPDYPGWLCKTGASLRWKILYAILHKQGKSLLDAPIDPLPHVYVSRNI